MGAGKPTASKMVKGKHVRDLRVKLKERVTKVPSNLKTQATLLIKILQ